MQNRNEHYSREGLNQRKREEKMFNDVIVEIFLGL